MTTSGAPTDGETTGATTAAAATTAAPATGSGEAVAWHALTPDEALQRQAVTVEAGLADAEVEKRHGTYGRNKFADAPKEPRWQAFLRQYKDPMQIVLLGAGILSLFIPSQFATGVLLIGLTLL